MNWKMAVLLLALPFILIEVGLIILLQTIFALTAIYGTIQTFLTKPTKYGERDESTRYIE